MRIFNVWREPKFSLNVVEFSWKWLLNKQSGFGRGAVTTKMCCGLFVKDSKTIYI